jgi:putative hydrolase of the HAD superfamily
LVTHWQEASHSGRVLMLHGAQQTLVALRARDVRTALICDTGLTPGRVVREHLDRLGLLHHLEVLVFSDEVGVPKPNAKGFRAALDFLGAEAKRCVHVGDIKRTDVAGGRDVGMQTVRITESHDDESDLAEADEVVEGHAELRAVLGV